MTNESPGRLAAVYRAIAASTPQLDLQILGRVLLHAALVGAAAGVIGAAFVGSVEWLEHAVLGTLAGYVPLCAAGESCPQPDGTTLRPWLFVVCPALGALLAGAIAHRYAPETLGGGADATIEAFHSRGGAMRRRSAPMKLVASVLTLGMGGSGGREGPTMQMGGAIGALVGLVLRVSARERRLLLVAGMAAGMAAVFRTPLGAALLAVEVFHRDDFESDALVPAVLASVVGYSVFTVFFGEGVLFAHAPRYPFTLRHLPLYVGLAIAASATGAVFVRALEYVRRKAQASRVPPWCRPAIGGLAVGAIAFPGIYLLAHWSSVGVGHRFGIVGGGYGAAQLAITQGTLLPPGLQGAGFLMTLAALKLVATACTVGSGGSAGDFGPSLTLGALVGGAFGIVAQRVDPSVDPGAFALVGMGTLYGGIAHVPLAAVVLVCELAGSYDLLVPLMLAGGVAFVLCRRVNLYPAQRASRRESPAHASDLDVLRAVSIRDVVVPSRPFESLERNTPGPEVLRRISASTWQDVFPVLEGRKLVGVVTSDVVRTLATSPELEHVAIAEDFMHPPVSVREDADLHAALAAMLDNGLREIIVVDSNGSIVGFLDESEVGAVYHKVTQEPAPASAATGTPRPHDPRK
ncbi:MAG: chloride channel protein [Polyangiaceae bacterium]|nr:chloride channel protein [Polyangiaceae bacterium]